MCNFSAFLLLLLLLPQWWSAAAGTTCDSSFPFLPSVRSFVEQLFKLYKTLRDIRLDTNERTNERAQAKTLLQQQQLHFPYFDYSEEGKKENFRHEEEK